MSRMLVVVDFGANGCFSRTKINHCSLGEKTGGEEILRPRLPVRLLPYRMAWAISCCMASITAMGSTALEMGRPTTT